MCYDPCVDFNDNKKVSNGRKKTHLPRLPSNPDRSVSLVALVSCAYIRNGCVLDPLPQGMLLREIHDEALARQRGHTSSVGSSISSQDGQQPRPNAGSSLLLLGASRPASDSSRPRLLQTQTTRSDFSADGRRSDGGVLAQRTSATDDRHPEEYAEGANQTDPPPKVASIDDCANPDSFEALPIGWEAVDSGTGGIVYYHELATGVTQWDMPKRDTARAGTTVAARATAENSWEEFQTDEGVSYWYNAATGESSWIAPGGG